MSSCGIETANALVNWSVVVYNPVDNDNMGDQQPVCGLENDLENNREVDHDNNCETDHENNWEDDPVVVWFEPPEDPDMSVLEGDPGWEVSDSETDTHETH